MKETKGQADPRSVNELVRAKLAKWPSDAPTALLSAL